MVTPVLFVQTTWTHTPSFLSLARAPDAHYLCHRCCSFRTLRTPRDFTRPVCSWRALLVPPMMQLVQSPHVSSLHSTHVVLAHTTCVTDVAAYALSARLKPLLDPYTPGAHYLYRQCYRLFYLRTFRAFTRPAWSWRELPVPPMLQLVHSSHASARLEPLLDQRDPGVHYLCHQCCSLCTVRAPRAFTRPGFSFQVLLVPPSLQLVVQSLNATGVYSTRLPRQAQTAPQMLHSLCSLQTPRFFTRPGFPGRH